MRARRILAIICYTVSMAAYAAAAYVSYISWTGEISFKLGFLIFLPIWIITYWFSTFFVQLIEKKKDGKTVWLIPKASRKILSGISSVISILLLGFWVYVYVTEYILSTR